MGNIDENKVDISHSADGDGLHAEAGQGGENSHHHSHGHHHSDGSHHHGEHHEGHHHHHRHKKHRKIKKLSSFVRKHRNALINTAFGIVIGVLVILLSLKFDGYDVGNGKQPSGDPSVPSSAIRIDFPQFNGNVPIVESAITEYVKSTDNQIARDFWKKYQGSTNRLDIGRPVNISYKVYGLSEGVSVTGAKVEVSERSDYSNARVFAFSGSSETAQVNLLKSATEYYYRITVTLTNGTVSTSAGKFKTASSPRLLNIEGINNARDIGGWPVSGGKVINQGLLYRGSELDGAIEPTYKLTEKGLVDMLSVLGIKTDMDLRSPSVNPVENNALGANVKHIYYGSAMYDGIFTDEQSEIMRQIFADLSNAENYPVYLHCTYGRDRTGTVCYLLGALLGMSQENLRKEYDLSAFVGGYSDFEGFSKLVSRIESYEGMTLRDKAENYLLSIGVTADQIASIRNIFLGE